jgi:hypothetical protein
MTATAIETKAVQAGKRPDCIRIFLANANYTADRTKPAAKIGEVHYFSNNRDEDFKIMPVMIAQFWIREGVPVVIAVDGDGMQCDHQTDEVKLFKV